jgi:deoxyribose-phosphate aldolase
MSFFRFFSKDPILLFFCSFLFSYFQVDFIIVTSNHVTINYRLKKGRKGGSLPDIDLVDRWIHEAGIRLGQSHQRGPGRPSHPKSFAGRIEHTLLRADAAKEDIVRICGEALQWEFRAVCCLPRDVGSCRKLLGSESVLVVTVINFPLAGNDDHINRAQCRRVLSEGAHEIDMVLDIRTLKRGDLEMVRDNVASVVSEAGGKTVKVILETGLLGPKEIVRGSIAAEAGGAHFVKTSTGFGPRGASEEDIVLMRSAIGNRLGIKAAGGIRDYPSAARLVEAGADVIGTSGGPNCLPTKLANE